MNHSVEIGSWSFGFIKKIEARLYFSFGYKRKVPKEFMPLDEEFLIVLNQKLEAS
jgi:hypothetical protein